MMYFADAAAGAARILEDRRILLVEDDFLIGLALKSTLERLGCIVTGPVPSVEKAVSMLENQSFEAAVLDINIIGGTSAPIANRLREQMRPFIFVTGYQSPGHLLPESLHSTKRLSKPVDELILAQALEEAFRDAGNG